MKLVNLYILFKASNGEIIIHGGGNIDDAQVTPDIAVLNTETFEWTAPIISSNIGKVPSLKDHTADLVGNYMIVAFGKRLFIFTIKKRNFTSLINQKL